MFAPAARKSLEAVLVVALRSNDHRLMDEPVEDTDWDEKIGILMDYMEESFAEVCDYSAENEIENFYKVAKNAVKEISEGEY